MIAEAVSDRGLVLAAPHRLAVEAGLRVARDGGTAVDAALAANAVLTVVYPHMCSIGGDLFALVSEPGGRIRAINGSGGSARAINAAALRRHGSMPVIGPLTISVPGTVAAWATLAELGGRMDFARLLAPAIEAALDGVEVAPSLARALESHWGGLQADSGMRDVFSSDNDCLRQGDLLRQPALGGTLERLVRDTPASFYHGSLAADLASALARMGSPLRAADFDDHATDITEPLRVPFRDYELVTTPPNSQGVLLLEIMKAVEMLGRVMDPAGPDAPLLAEIMRVSALDRDAYLADPRRARVPVEALLSSGHVGSILDRAQARQRAPFPAIQGAAPLRGDTIAITAADSQGWGVVLIQSIFHAFGCQLLDPATGIIFHNRGAYFSLDAKSPNVLEGAKRPLHTLMPVMVQRDARTKYLSGTMGGTVQPQIQAQLLIRLLDLGQSLKDAIHAPRWVVGASELGGVRDVVFVESRLAALVPEFEAVDMPTAMLGGFDEEVGHAQLAAVRESGVLEAASDPRADGGAGGLESPPSR